MGYPVPRPLSCQAVQSGSDSRPHSSPLNISFIFDRCRPCSAAVIPDKYKCDSNNLRSTFARSKLLLPEKLTCGVLEPPPLVPCARGSKRHDSWGKGVTCAWTLVLG